MNYKNYYKYSIYLPALLFLLATGCATSPKRISLPETTVLEPSPEPPESFKEIFISQSEGEEKISSQLEMSEKLLSFSLNNADIQETLLALSKESGLNFVVDPDIEGQVTVDLKK